MDQEMRQAFDFVLKSLESMHADIKGVKDGLESARTDIKGVKDGQVRLESRMGSVESKVGSMESKVGSMESKIDALQERQAQTTKAVRALDTFTRQGFDTLIGMIESVDIRKADKLASS